MRPNSFSAQTCILVFLAAWISATSDKLTTNNDLVFSVSSDDTNQPCLRARFSLKFNISYVNKNTEIVKREVQLKSWNSYKGVCESQLNSLTINFNDNWSLNLNYTVDGIKSAKYHLDGISLTYSLASVEFPDSIRQDQMFVKASPIYQFPSQLASSYKCSSPSRIQLGDNVQLEFTDYQAQAFIHESSGDFDTAVECPADLVMSGSYVPMIAGMMLPVIVTSSYIAYVVAKKRRMTRYHHV